MNSALVSAQTQMQNKLDQAVASINLELANLQDQINALDGDQALELVLALQAAFTEAEAKIAVLEAFIASAEAADLASALESEVAALYAALSDNVATLNSSLTALQASLQANIDQVSSDLSAALNAAIADLQAQINGLSTDSATAADVSALAAQLAATQADLATLATLSAAGDAANADALAAEVANLNSALVSAQTQMQNKLDQAVADIHVELANLQDQINALDGDQALELVLALQAAFAEAEAKIAVLEAFIASAEAADLAAALESEVAALYAALSDNVATLNSSLTVLQASLQANIDQVSSDLSAALNAAIADLQAQIDGLNTDSATAADLSALAAQLASTQAELAALATLSAAGDAANAGALAAEVSSLNSALVSAQTQMQNKLDQAVASINLELANLQDQINALDGDQALELVLALQAAFTEAEAKIAVLEAFIASAEAADLAAALESEVAALYAALSDNVATLNSSLTVLQASLQANIDQVSSDLSAALNAAIADLQAQIDGLSTDSATAADVSALAAQLAATQADLAALTTLSAAGDAANADALAAEVSSLNSALVSAQTQMQNKLDQAVADIHVELANLQDQINALDGDQALELVLALQAAFAEAEAKIAVLEAFIASAEAADLASALESEVAALYAALSDNVATLNSSLTALHTSLVAYVDQVSNDLFNSLDSSLTNLQMQINGLENATAANLSDLAAELAATKGELAALATLSAAGDAANAQALATEVASLTSALAALETSLENSIVEATSALSASLNATIADLQAQITGLSAESATAADLSALAAQLTATQADLDALATLSAAGDAANASVLAAEVISLTSALESLETHLQDSIDQVSSNLTTALETAIADLQAQIDGLTTDNETAAVDLEALTEEIETLKQEIDDLKLALGVDTGLSDTLEDLQDQITDLQAQIDDLKAALEALQPPTDPFEGDTLVFTVAELFGSNGTASVNIIAEALLDALANYDASTITIKVTEPLTVAQSTALSQAGLVAGADKVEYDIRDYATTVQAALANPDQSLALVGAGQVVAIGNELNNTLDMAAMTSDINLRVELDDGNDTYFAGRGDETIVGGAGADTIYLTHRDGSVDTVVYQSILDGQVLPSASIAFSTDESDYREGTVLTLTVNGHSYSYTLEKGETSEVGLQALADLLTTSSSIMGVTVNADEAKLTVFAASSPLQLSGGHNGTEAIVNDGLKTQVVVNFSSNDQDYPANTNGTNTTEFTRYLSVTISGVVIKAEVVAGDANASVTALVAAINAARSVEDETTLVEEGIYLGDIIDEASAQGTTITLTALKVGETDGPTFSVQEASIDVPGVQQEVSVQFSLDDTYYYEGGELRIKINDDTIAVEMVAGDAKATIEKLKQAIADQGLGSLESIGFSVTDFTVKPTARTGLANNILSFSANDLDLSSATGIQILQTGSSVFRSSTAGSIGFNFHLLENAIYEDVNALVTAINAILSSDPAYRLTASYNSEFNSLDFQVTSGGFNALIPVSALTFKGQVTDGITLLSSTEGEDTLSITAEMDYAGEAQQATLELNSNSGKYTGFTFDNDDIGPGNDRAADVYFEDGKVWITITPLDANGEKDTVNAVRISAEMGANAAETQANLVDAINEKVNGSIIPATPNTYTLSNSNYPSGELQESYLLNGFFHLITFNDGINNINADYLSGHVKTLAEHIADLNAHFSSLSIDATAEIVDNSVLVVKTPLTLTFMRSDVFFQVEQGYPLGSIILTVSSSVLGSPESLDQPDPVLSQLLAGAEVSGNGITLTAKDNAKQTFEISDITLDYQGVKQIATATFTTSDEAYYQGGRITLEVKLGDGDSITFAVPMKANEGPALETLNDLKALLQEAINDETHDLYIGDVIGAVLFNESTGEFTLVSKESVKEAFTIEKATISIEPVQQQATASFSNDEADYYEGGSIGLTVNGKSYVQEMLGSTSGPALLLNFNMHGDVDITLTQDDLVIFSIPFFTLSIDHQNYDYNEFTYYAVNEHNQHHHQIPVGIFLLWLESLDGIERAELTEGENQIKITPDSGVTIDFTGSLWIADADTHYYFNLHSASLGSVVFQSEESIITSTLEALKAQIEADIAQDDDDSFGLESITLNGSTFTFTAKDAEDGYGEINITDVFKTLPAQAQITEVDFSGVLPQSVLGGEQPEVSLGIAGTQITAKAGTDDNATVINLAQALIDARDGVFESNRVAQGIASEPAVLRIALPEGVSLDSILSSDQSYPFFEIAINNGSMQPFSWHDSNDYPGVNGTATFAEFIDYLNAGLSPDASVEFDADSNELVLTSTSVGESAALTLSEFRISGFVEKAELSDGVDVGPLEAEGSDGNGSSTIKIGLPDLFGPTDGSHPIFGLAANYHSNFNLVISINYAGEELNLQFVMKDDIYGDDSFLAGYSLSVTGDGIDQVRYFDGLGTQNYSLSEAIGYMNGQLDSILTALELPDLDIMYDEGGIVLIAAEGESLALLNNSSGHAFSIYGNMPLDNDIYEFTMDQDGVLVENFHPEYSLTLDVVESSGGTLPAKITLELENVNEQDFIQSGSSVTLRLTINDGEDEYPFEIVETLQADTTMAQLAELFTQALEGKATVEFDESLNAFVITSDATGAEVSINLTEFSLPAIYNSDFTVIDQLEIYVLHGSAQGSEYFALIGEQPLSADDALSFERIEGTLIINDTEVVIDFMPTQASDGAKTGSSVQDFIDYLNSFTLVESVELINGVIAITPVVNPDGPTTIDANLSFNVQTDRYAEADYSNAVVDLTGAEAVAFEPAEPAALTIDFFYTGTPTSFTNFDIRLNVNDGPLLQAQGVIAAGSSLADIATALNASSAFSGSVVFEAVGSDQLIARTVETGAEAKLSFVSASLFTDVGAGTGVANDSPANGKDEVLAEDAKNASVLLTEFANLKETAVLKDGDYDVALLINGQPVTEQFNATGDATVTDYLAFIESALQGMATVELTADGLQITTLATGDLASIEIAAGGLSLTTFAVPVAAIADSVGKVNVDGTTLILTGKNPGPDQMNVDDQGYTYQVIDPDLSRVQVIDLNFSNSQLDNVSTTPKGTLISVTVDGITSSVKLWDGTDPEDAVTHVNVAGLTSTRSEVIVAALKAQMILDHGLSSAPSESQLGMVLQGFVNIATGEFEESANSNSLRLVSGEFGPNSLGSIAEGSISVLVVNAANVTLTNAVSAETVEEGTFVFKDETSSLKVFDKTHEPGSQYAQTGQDAAVVNYNDSASGSAAGSDYLLTLLGDNLANFIDGYTSGLSLSQLFDQYGINKDYLYDEYALGEYTNTAPDDSFASVTVTELAGLVSGGRTASDYALKAGSYSFTIHIDDREAVEIEFTAGTSRSLADLIKELRDQVNVNWIHNIATIELTQEGLVITSSDSGASSAVSFSSDTPLFIQSVAMLNGLLDINDQVKEGVEAKDVDEAWVNPGTDHNNDFENASYYGDSPLSGENNEGVQQTHTNPESGYVADAHSPNPDAGNTNQGDDSLFGSDPGIYTDAGLVTDYLNGGTQNGDGVYTSIDDKDLTTIITETETVEGEDASELTASDSEDLDIEVVEEGFAEYAWDDSVVAVLSSGISGPDVIHHFQVEHDLIALEGDLLQSTVSGEVEYQTSVTNPDGEVLAFGFDLSETEFGFISAAHNQAANTTVAAADLTNAEKVADLLNDLFNFNAVTDNHEINTSIFAVAAADNADVTAIWAHQQSSTDDSSVESYEMKLLALVNTTGGELTAENFLPQPSEQLLG
ncbi:hypothetical protein [Nitrincola alkalisediminis]